MSAPDVNLDEALRANAQRMNREAIDQAWQAAAARPVVDPFIRADNVVERRVEWLWDRRLPRVGLAVVGGDGGVGKSTVVQKVAAAITRGEPLPHGGNRYPAAGVVILSAEEDTAAVMTPRMRLMGADLTRVLLLDPEHGASFTLPSGIDQLDDACKNMDAGLVVIDSGPAFLDKGLKPNDEADIRRMLRPLAILAERRRVLVIVLAHLNKGQGNAGQRVMGGAAWRNAPRLLLLIGPPEGQHPSETSERMLVVEKSNLGRFPAAVGFTLTTFTENPDLADVAWGDLHADVHAGDLVTQAGDRDERNATVDAADWLRAMLADGPRTAGDLIKLGRRDGVAERTLQRAGSRLGVAKSRSKFGGAWEWSLPEERLGASSPSAYGGLGGIDRYEDKTPANTYGATKAPGEEGWRHSGVIANSRDFAPETALGANTQGVIDDLDDWRDLIPDQEVVK